jgi:hypothetical protein
VQVAGEKVDILPGWHGRDLAPQTVERQAMDARQQSSVAPFLFGISRKASAKDEPLILEHNEPLLDFGRQQPKSQSQG